MAPGDYSPGAPTDPYVRVSAYGSSNHGFTARDVIRGGCVDTKPRFDVLAVCPRHGSMIRRRASLHRVRSGTVPPLPRYYHGATTSCRPSRRPSSPSRGGTTRCVWGFAPPSARRPTERPGVFGFGFPSLPIVPVEMAGSPKFLGNPACLCAHALRLRSACTPLTHTRRQHGPRH